MDVKKLEPPVDFDGRADYPKYAGRFDENDHVYNWVYWIESVLENEDEILRQLKLANEYRNHLVKIERRRRKQTDELVRSLSPEYDAACSVVDGLNLKFDAIVTELKQARRRARRRVDPTPEQQDQLDLVKAQLKEAYENVSELKQAAYEKLNELREHVRQKVTASYVPPLGTKPKRAKQLLTEEITKYLEVEGIDGGDGQAARDKRAFRRSSECYWGTYNIVEESLSKMHSGPPPRYRDFDGQGAVGTQTDAPAAQVLGLEGKPSTKLQIDPQTKIAKLRIGSIGRDPLWAVLKIRDYHRPIPADSEIKYAKLFRMVVGTRVWYRLQLTISTKWDTQPPRPGNKKAVAVHLGSRLVDDKIRVATYVGTDGKQGRLMIPQRMIEGFEIPHQLQSLSDSQFNDVRNMFSSWLRQTNVPEWLASGTEFMGHWRNAQAMYPLMDLWRENRFEADAQSSDVFKPLVEYLRPTLSKPDVIAQQEAEFFDIDTVYGVLQLWRRWDAHIYDWKCNQQRDIAVTRDQMYRVFTKWLRYHYDKVYLIRVNWAALARKATEEFLALTPEQRKTDLASVQRRYARVASPGRLAQFLQERFRDDALYVKVAGITNRCYACGHVEEWNRARLHHQCTKCGNTFDQDVNAVKNQLDLGVRAETVGYDETVKKKPKVSRRTRYKAPPPDTPGKSGPPQNPTEPEA